MKHRLDRRNIRLFPQNFVRSELGGGLVEFAIVGGLILAPMLLGILEFGYATWARNGVTADAREGTRYAVVHGATSGAPATVDSVRKYVRSKTSLDTLGTDSIRVYVTWPTDKNPGSMVHVSVVHNVPRRGLFIPGHVDSATSKMAILY